MNNKYQEIMIISCKYIIWGEGEGGEAVQGMNTLRRERNAWQNSFFIRVAFILRIRTLI